LAEEGTVGALLLLAVTEGVDRNRPCVVRNAVELGEKEFKRETAPSSSH
jgi:hypothetical protein